MKYPLVFIKHILENIQKIESFSENLSKNELLRNDLKQYAIIRAIEVKNNFYIFTTFINFVKIGIIELRIDIIPERFDSTNPDYL